MQNVLSSLGRITFSSFVATTGLVLNTTEDVFVLTSAFRDEKDD